MSRERTWLDLDVVESAIPEMEARGVSKVARSARGFIPRYRKAGGDPDDLDDGWREQRNAFLARHIAQAESNGEPWWENGEPTRRHLALVAWAYSPTRAKLEDWLEAPRVNPFWASDPRTLPPTRRQDKGEHSKNAEKRYQQAHWGNPAKQVYEWPDVPDDLELTEMGKLVEIQYELDDSEDEVAVLEFFQEVEAQTPDILCFVPDNTERLFLALSERSKRAAQKLWVRRYATYKLPTVAKSVGGRQARKVYPFEKDVTVQAIAPVAAIVYFADKHGDGPSDYEHEMGEWGGIRPMLCLAKDGRMFLAGGSYLVHNDGITK